MARKKAPKEIVTRVVVVLDKSGSMESIRDVTVRNFNEQVQTIKSTQKPGMKTLVTLAQFNHAAEFTFTNEDVANLQEITLEQYEPRGSTALFDAVGDAIESVAKVLDPKANEAALIIVITDGEENSSKRWTSAALAEKIQTLTDTKKWTFTYVGPEDVDLSKVAQKLHIPIGNTVAYGHGRGPQDVHIDVALSDFYVSRSSGATSSATFFGADGGKVKR